MKPLSQSPPRETHLGIALAYSLALTALLLVPLESPRYAAPVFLSHGESLARHRLGDVVLNVAAFVPIGLLYRLSLRNHRPVVGAALVIAGAAAFSLAVESLQYVMQTRHSSVIDVASNTVGAAAGVIVSFAPRWRRRTARETATRSIGDDGEGWRRR